jgi:HEAT repeat protein
MRNALPAALFCSVLVSSSGCTAGVAKRSETVAAPSRSRPCAKFLGGTDGGIPGGISQVVDTLSAGSFWVQRTKPEMVSCLIAIREDSTADPLSRDQALATLGATGQYSAYEYIARTFDASDPNADDRVLATQALGNGSWGSEPPAFVFQRLEQAIDSGNESVRIAAAMSLGRITSPRADSTLRARLLLEHSPNVLHWIQESLARHG